MVFSVNPSGQPPCLQLIETLAWPVINVMFQTSFSTGVSHAKWLSRRLESKSSISMLAHLQSFSWTDTYSQRVPLAWPAGVNLYILDFIDSNGVHINVTQLNIYDMVSLDTTAVHSFITRVPVGCNVYTLNPSRVVEIVTKDGQLLKRILFIYIYIMTCTPILDWSDDWPQDR